MDEDFGNEALHHCKCLGVFSPNLAEILGLQMAVGKQDLYQQLGSLISVMPNLRHYPMPKETLIFLGQAEALIDQLGDSVVAIDFRMAMHNLVPDGSSDAATRVTLALYRALAKAELMAPSPARGAFIPAGNSFDAMKAVGSVLNNAASEILLLDPYMDATTLTDFASLAPDSVQIRVLAEQGKVKSTLKPAILRWQGQYQDRPLVGKLAAPGQLHDRAIFIDKKEVYLVSQSFNALATRSPATIQKLDMETAGLKASAYEQIWQSAAII